jgi:cyclopropane-fatty-acyl-phospholipid synthase
MQQLIPRTLRLWENVSSNLAKATVISRFQGMTKGHLTLRVNGEPRSYSFGYGNKVKAEILVKNDRFFSRFWNEGETGFGESYVEGDWDSPDLAQVIRWFFLNVGKIESVVRSDDKNSPLLQFMVGLRYIHDVIAAKPFPVAASRASGYDLQRPFFALMLDEGLNNSGALYSAQDNETLEHAQLRKHRAIAQELHIRPGDRILELGCGWGSFAVYLAQNYDCHVTAVTVSEEQFQYLSARIDEYDLGTKIQPVHSDYHRVQGVYDRIASIEFIDTIEPLQLSDFFRRCDLWLKPHGNMVHQLLLSPESRIPSETADERNPLTIAPGLMTPSLSQLVKAMGTSSDFSIRNLRDTGLSYSSTLHVWVSNFTRNLEAVRSLGFDERFIRNWHYYLSYAEAAFEHGLVTSALVTLNRTHERNSVAAETSFYKLHIS